MADIQEVLSGVGPSRPLGILPTWWEGESLYGWCSRLHALRGGPARALGQELFGREHACRVVDMPSGLGLLEKATRGKLGTSMDILRQRTVMAAYWPFAPDSTRQLLTDAATEENGLPFTAILGLPAGRMGAFHPLRACPDCVVEAARTQGYATWLLPDQLPGVWWCPKHHRPLHQVVARRAIWHKPGQPGVALGSAETADEAHALEMMRALAICMASCERINSLALSAAIVDRLQSLAIAVSSTRLRVDRLNRWFEESPHARWIRRQDRAVVAPGANWIVPTLRARSRSHPLKWALLWTAAFRSESVADAVEAFRLAAEGMAVQTRGTQYLLWPEKWGRATDSGVPAEVEDAFLSSHTLRDVAAKLGSSTSSVKAWLHDYPTFERQWLERVRQWRMQRARHNFIQAITQNPDLSRSEVLLVCKTDAEWLSRHAPLTLRSLLNRLQAQRGAQGQLF